jgi:hypothetical protein
MPRSATALLGDVDLLPGELMVSVDARVDALYIPASFEHE